MGTRMYATSNTNQVALEIAILADRGLYLAPVDVERAQGLIDAFKNAPRFGDQSDTDPAMIAYRNMTDSPVADALDNLRSYGFGKLTSEMYQYCDVSGEEQYGGGCDDKTIIPRLLKAQGVTYLSPSTIALIDRLGWG